MRDYSISEDHAKLTFPPMVTAMAVTAALLCTFAFADNTDTVISKPEVFTRIGLNSLRQQDEMLTGSQVFLGLVCRSISYDHDQTGYDYLPMINHNCFLGSDILFEDDGEMLGGVSNHATAICGLLTGLDPDAKHPDYGSFAYVGALPGAAFDVYEFHHFIEEYLYNNNPVTPEILSLSIGSCFEDWWTRGFQALAEHQDKIIIAAAGNGTDAFDPLLYPAAGGNVIAVGVIENLADGSLGLVYPESSSSGPTIEGTSKPDLVAPGICMVPDTESQQSYTLTEAGTSYAAPVVSGTVGLLLDKAKQDAALYRRLIEAGPGPMLKSILMTSADKLPYWHKGKVSPEDDTYYPGDRLQGAGMVNAQKAMEILLSPAPADSQTIQSPDPAGWSYKTLLAEPEAYDTYDFSIEQPAGKRLAATLTWNRHFENQYPFAEINSQFTDLRLELWALYPEGAVIIDECDSPWDNLEHLFTPLPADCTQYRLIVRFNPQQLFNQLERNSENYCLSWQVHPEPDKQDIRWFDLNRDGDVTIMDFAFQMENYSVTDTRDLLAGDINLDGTVDLADVQAMLNAILRVHPELWQSPAEL